MHDPLCLSHTPPFSHTGQASVQARPQNPSGHKLSQCCPDVPAGHLHCPVTLSQGAPVQLQGCTQPDPNLPSGQSWSQFSP